MRDGKVSFSFIVLQPRIWLGRMRRRSWWCEVVVEQGCVLTAKCLMEIEILWKSVFILIHVEIWEILGMLWVVHECCENPWMLSVSKKAVSIQECCDILIQWEFCDFKVFLKVFILYSLWRYIHHAVNWQPVPPTLPAKQCAELCVKITSQPRIYWFNEEIFRFNVVLRQKSSMIESLRGSRCHERTSLRINWLQGFLISAHETIFSKKESSSPQKHIKWHFIL